MEYQFEKKQAPGWGEVDVLGATYEAGRPEGEEAGRWRYKLRDRQERLKYLEAGERYWYSQEWFGSEKRKNPA
jgi:hypothetical protein